MGVQEFCAQFQEEKYIHPGAAQRRFSGKT